MGSPSSKDEKVDWIIKTPSHQELAQRYDAWATDYDADLISYGYLTPAVVAGMVCRYCRPGGGPILDAGSGTGQMGEILSALGYGPLIALDISAGMLEVAKQKGIYSELHQMTLGKHLDFEDDKFDACVSTGVFVASHAPPQAFDELVRITRSEGHIIFNVRPNDYENRGYREKQDQLEKAGKWKLLESTRPFHHLPLNKNEAQTATRVFVYKVL